MDGHASSVHLPKAEDIDKVETDPGACHAVAYDIVLNGVEMGGGSMRINDPALQDRMFKALALLEEKARESWLPDGCLQVRRTLRTAAWLTAQLHGNADAEEGFHPRCHPAFLKAERRRADVRAPDIADPQQLKDLSIALTLTE